MPNCLLALVATAVFSLCFFFFWTRHWQRFIRLNVHWGHILQELKEADPTIFLQPNSNLAISAILVSCSNWIRTVLLGLQIWKKSFIRIFGVLGIMIDFTVSWPVMAVINLDTRFYHFVWRTMRTTLTMVPWRLRPRRSSTIDSNVSFYICGKSNSLI